MRILEGVGTLVQLGGLMARLCRMYVSRLPFVVTCLTISRLRHYKPELFRV